MRHNVDGRKFGRNTSNRLAMFRNMANSVIKMEQIQTTVQKAKEVRRVVDRLITLGKNGTLHSRRLAFDRTRDQVVVKKLFSELAERYKNRAGGYTRVLKLADRRWGDAAEMAVIELVDHPAISRKRTVKSSEKSEGESTSPKAASETKGFKKMFSRKSENAGKAQSTKAASKAKSGGGAARRTPAAGGANKSGGSS
jgi:large subunit ribosomal protein L17